MGRVEERQRGRVEAGERAEPELLRGYGLWLLGLGFMVLALLGTWADVDLRFSRYFYHPAAPQPWFLKTATPWIWLNRYGEYPAWLLAAGAAVLWCGSLRRRAWVRYRRACVLCVLALALGPGLLVNGVLKPLWGRPRPHQVEIFGGSQPYRYWWQPDHLGGGRSFASGHAATGYGLVAGTYLVAQRRRRLALGGVLIYGSLVGLARVIAGAHFVSDVLWSGSLMCFMVATLQAALPAMGPPDLAPGFAPTKDSLYNRATLEPS